MGSILEGLPGGRDCLGRDGAEVSRGRKWSGGLSPGKLQTPSGPGSKSTRVWLDFIFSSCFPAFAGDPGFKGPSWVGQNSLSWAEWLQATALTNTYIQVPCPFPIQEIFREHLLCAGGNQLFSSVPIPWVPYPHLPTPVSYLPL